MHHTIKTHAELYHRVKSGEKRFDIRKDDRNYQCGDTVTLEYFDSPAAPPHGNEPLDFRIGFVLRGGQYGLEPGYVAFQLEPAELPDCDDPAKPFGGINRLAPDNWAQHDGKGVPKRVHGVKGVEVRYRNLKQESFFGPAVMPFTLWEWGTVFRDEDVISYRVLPNDWIAHGGKITPDWVRPNCCVDVKLRDGTEFRTNFPNDLKWIYNGKDTPREIVAYKIV